jgi:hypothetical protein
MLAIVTLYNAGTKKMSARIAHLAAQISEASDALNGVLDKKSITGPSFDTESSGLPRELDALRNKILDATSELHDLLLPPADLLKTYATVS